jgi:hypothetical protein
MVLLSRPMVLTGNDKLAGIRWRDSYVARPVALC